MPPLVSAKLPRLTVTPVLPGAASEPMVSLANKVSAAPAAIVTGDVSGMACPPAACNNPASSEVVPV